MNRPKDTPSNNYAHFVGNNCRRPNKNSTTIRNSFLAHYLTSMAIETIMIVRMKAMSVCVNVCIDGRRIRVHSSRKYSGLSIQIIGANGGLFSICYVSSSLDWIRDVALAVKIDGRNNEGKLCVIKFYISIRNLILFLSIGCVWILSIRLFWCWIDLCISVVVFFLLFGNFIIKIVNYLIICLTRKVGNRRFRLDASFLLATFRISSNGILFLFTPIFVICVHWLERSSVYFDELKTWKKSDYLDLRNAPYKFYKHCNLFVYDLNKYETERLYYSKIKDSCRQLIWIYSTVPKRYCFESKVKTSCMFLGHSSNAIDMRHSRTKIDRSNTLKTSAPPCMHIRVKPRSRHT